MKFLKNIWAVLVGIGSAILLLISYLVFCKKEGCDDIEPQEEQIKANNDALKSEEELREQIKEEMANAKDAEVTQDQLVNFYNERKPS